MRTIKFRGLRTNGKGWVYGDLAYFFNQKKSTMIMPNCYFGTRDFGDEDENENPIISNEMALGGFINVIPESVGQFTGLKDKNGKESCCVYEGDIVSLDGIIIGNIYENKEMDKDATNIIIAKMGTREWRNSEKEAMERGCKYS